MAPFGSWSVEATTALVLVYPYAVRDAVRRLVLTSWSDFEVEHGAERSAIKFREAARTDDTTTRTSLKRCLISSPFRSSGRLIR
mmetsp:Transcript_65001/g.136194  ORF Transcript_65001/g.136194 Transcript_65001/m.136194 type:complete len:84 (-) Transcript_65001:1441-1692(-)